ncbi:MAG: class I adenylate-forming enzyme family protein [Acidimicrobiales bacterium]
MPSLIALAMPGGPDFVAALVDAWESGHAVTPIDGRLPAPALEAVLASLAPDVLVDSRGERHHLVGGQPVETGDALVVATSGTTGSPRGVVLTHDAVAASARATSAALGVDPSSDRWLACLPLAHVGGLSVVTRAVLTGTPLVVHPRFDPDEVAAAAGGSEPVTLVSLVARSLGPAGGAGRVGVAGAGGEGGRLGRRVDPFLFRLVLLGGSAPPTNLPPNVVTTYGMTETGSGVVYDGLPLEGVEVELGPASEIRLRGPMLCKGYRDGSEACDAEGWLTTGDVGAIEDGRLVVKGRLDELIVTGGENVWPAPVEAAILEHPGVAEVAVVGRADAEWGERLVAFVVPAGGVRATPPTLDELRAMVKDRLGAWAAPRELVLVESLPRTAIGKVRRRALLDA